jgi:hypothetical protein
MTVTSIFLNSIKFLIIVLNFVTMIGFLYLSGESDNINSLAAPVLLNLYLTYLTVNFFFNFFESASYTLMMCLAVDFDLTDTGLPEFGPSTFH